MASPQPSKMWRSEHIAVHTYTRVGGSAVCQEPSCPWRGLDFLGRKPQPVTSADRADDLTVQEQEIAREALQLWE